MSKDKDNFEVSASPVSGGSVGSYTVRGMTKREWFIGQALAGISSRSFNAETVAAISIQYADAVIAQLNKVT